MQARHVFQFLLAAAVIDSKLQKRIQLNSIWLRVKMKKQSLQVYIR